MRSLIKRKRQISDMPKRFRSKQSAVCEMVGALNPGGFIICELKFLGLASIVRRSIELIDIGQ